MESEVLKLVNSPEKIYWQPKKLVILLQNTHKDSSKVHNETTIATDDLNHRNRRAADAYSL